MIDTSAIEAEGRKLSEAVGAAREAVRLVATIPRDRLEAFVDGRLSVHIRPLVRRPCCCPR